MGYCCALQLPRSDAIVYHHYQQLPLFFFSLKHPAKYIGRKPRKYTIPAKPLAPIQQQTPDGGPEQVRMYREPSSGALHPSQYIRVRLVGTLA